MVLGPASFTSPGGAICQRCKLPGLTPDLLNQKLEGWRVICILANFPVCNKILRLAYM